MSSWCLARPIFPPFPAIVCLSRSILAPLLPLHVCMLLSAQSSGPADMDARACVHTPTKVFEYCEHDLASLLDRSPTPPFSEVHICPQLSASNLALISQAHRAARYCPGTHSQHLNRLGSCMKHGPASITFCPELRACFARARVAIGLQGSAFRV